MSIPSQISYKVDQKLVPKYRYVKLSPQTQNSNITVGPTSMTAVPIEIPTVVHNNARSFVSLDYACPQSTTTGSYLMMNNDVPPFIARLSLNTRSNSQQLVEIPFVPQFMKTILPRNLDYKSYMCRDSEQYFAPSNEMVGSPVIGLPKMVQTADFDAKTVATTGSTTTAVWTTVVTPTVASSGAITASTYPSVTTLSAGNITSTGRLASVNMLENKHIRISAASDNDGKGDNKTNAGKLTGTLRFYLGDLKETLLSYDKDIIFPEVLTLTVYLGMAQRHVVEMKSTTGGLPPIDQATTNLVSYGGSVTFNNVYLNLAVEDNQTIADNVSRLLDSKSGYELAIPWTQTHIQPFDQKMTSQNISRAINKLGESMYLKRIYHTIFPADESYAHTALDNSNSTRFATAAKLTSYQTMFNSQNLQQQIVNCEANDDWVVNYPYLRDKAVLNRDNYKYSWSHLDDWTNGQDEENTLVGMPMAMNSYTWAINTTCPSNAFSVNHYLFVVFNRLMSITKERGVVLL